MEELVKLANEKGFKPNTFSTIWTRKGFCQDEKYIPMINEMCCTLYLFEVQTWLRNEWSIFIDIKTLTNVNEIMGFEVRLRSWRFPPKQVDDDRTYEGSLKIGLLEALKFIKL